MSQQPKRTSAAAPISAHPAFPAIVALWFAALLGIGSLVLPIALFERASEATGLANVIAAAQAPLGTTARLAIALGLAGAGALLGLAIARKVKGEAPAPRKTTSHTAKAPLSAHDELFEGGFDAGDDLACFDPGRRSDAEAAAAQTDGDNALLPEVRAADNTPEANAPLDLAAFGGPVQDQDLPEVIEPDQDHSLIDGPAEASALAPPRPLAELGMAELVERFARALQQHRTLAESGAHPAAVRLAAHSDSFAEDEKGYREDGAADVHYPSLLAVKSPFGASPEAARPLAELRSRPARAATPRRPADDERSLREALAKLQKLSGAA